MTIVVGYGRKHPVERILEFICWRLLRFEVNCPTAKWLGLEPAQAVPATGRGAVVGTSNIYGEK